MARTRPVAELSVVFEQLEDDVGIVQLRKAARLIGDFIATEMSRNAPRDTGKTASSITYAIERGATVDQIVVKVGPDRKTGWKAHFLEFGTKAHQIKAKKAHVLANMKTGEVFGSAAKHPGSQAQPFVIKTLDDNQNEAAEKFGEFLHDQIVKAFE